MTKGFIRFIAGAVCPSCKAQDKIAITPDDKTIYCLNCDFKEKKPEDIEKKPLNSNEPKVFNIDDFRPKKSQNLSLFKAIIARQKVSSKKQKKA